MASREMRSMRFAGSDDIYEVVDAKARQDLDNQLKPRLSAVEAFTVKPSGAYELAGDIVQLDNYEGMPMNVVTRIEPVQSGSGDPYPGGGGKNLLPDDKLTVQDKNIRAYFNDPEGFLLYAGVTYTLSLGSTPADAVYVTTMDKAGGDGDIAKAYAKTSVTFTPSENVRAQFNAYWASGRPTDAYMMLELGSTVTAYAPYSNIRPITGHAEDVLTRRGKNLFDFTEITNKPFGSDPITLTVTGSTVILKGTPSAKYRQTIGVIDTRGLAGKTVTLSGQVSGDYPYAVCQFKDSEGVIKTTIALTSSGSNTGTVDETCVTANFVMCLNQSSFGEECTATYSNIQLELGSAATEYEPYHADTFTVDFGKNLANLTYGSTVPSISNGQETAAAGSNWSSDYIAIDASRDMVFSVSESNDANNMYLFAYDNDKAYIGYTATPIKADSTTVYLKNISGYKNAKYCRLRLDALSTSTFKAQFEYGSTPTPFVPYNADLVAKTGGMVYGGTYDWNTGLLIVDKVTVTLDGTEDWKHNYGTHPNQVYLLLNNDKPKGYVDSYCSHLLASPRGGYDANKQNSVSMSSSAIWVYSSIADTLANFKAYLAAQYAAGTPVQLCYELAEPITIQLTPQDILALGGANMLYAEAGDVTVSGRKDILWLTRDLKKRTDTLEKKDNMPKSVYDTNGSGVVDDAEKLGGQPPSYYELPEHLKVGGGEYFITGDVTTVENLDGMPMTVVTHIEPEQSGSGDPYPAGGGKNLIDIPAKSQTSLGYICDKYKLSTPIQPGTYTFSCKHNIALSTGWWVKFENAAGESIGSTGTLYSRDSGATIEITGVAVSISIYVNGAASMSDMQLEAGSVATEYAPYSNIRPITGHVVDVLTRCGKNLTPSMSVETLTKNGITFSKNTDGTVVLNGTSTGYTSAQSAWIAAVNLRGKTVTLKGANAPGISVTQMYIQCESGNIFKSCASGNDVMLTFSIPEDANTMRWEVYLPANKTASNLVIYPQLELGSASTAYEPYHSDTFTADFGKNLLPNTAATWTTNGITFTVESDGTIVANGTSSARAQLEVGSVELPPGDYIASQGFVGNSNTSGVAFVQFTKGEEAAFVDMSGKAEATFTLDETSTVTFKCDVRTSGVTLNNLVYYPMIRRASVADSTYVPYNSSLPGMVYGGTYDWNTGVLTVDRGYRVFDGSENWTGAGSKFTNCLAFNVTVSDCVFNDNRWTEKASSHMKTLTANEYGADNNINGIGGYGRVVTIKLSRTLLGNAAGTNAEHVDDFKTYLAAQHAAGTPVQIVYKLDTPITIQLTPQEILALGGVNTLYAEVGAVTISGKRNIFTLLESLQKRIKTLGV